MSIPAPASLWRSSSYADPRSAKVQYSHAIVMKRSSPRARAQKGLPDFLQLDRHEIRQKWRMLDALQKERLHESKIPNSDWAIVRTQEALARNRYSNIHPWANNRIHLNVPEGHCDYINASPIELNHGLQGPKHYIATQGPKQGQYHHMWRMVWEETSSVAVIVMLTRVLESGQHKCFQYFPLSVDDAPWVIDGDEEFGDGFHATLRVTEKTRYPDAGCTMRRISMVVGGREKIVWHFLFKGWPDFGVPTDADKLALTEMMRHANSRNTPGPENPIIVHCSAGVGRTGTYITLDYLLREIELGGITETEEYDPVYDTVEELRRQRMYMVQSEPQYHFIYDVLREKFQAAKRPRPGLPPSVVTLHAMVREEVEEEVDGNRGYE